MLITTALRRGQRREQQLAGPVRCTLRYACRCSAGTHSFPTAAQAVAEQRALRGVYCPYCAARILREAGLLK